MQALNPKDLIVIDESGCYLNMTLPYGRAYGKERVSFPKPFTKKNKVSIIGAVSVDTLYGEWNTDYDIFLTFIEQKIVPKLSKNKVVILDNVPFHKKQKVIDAIENAGAKVLFLPPYSPEFSPIENMWSKIKQMLKKLAPRTMSEFNKAISIAFNAITKENLFGWFKHCGYEVGSI